MCLRILRIQAIVPIEDIRGKGAHWETQVASGGKGCPKSHLEECSERSEPGKELRQSFPDIACPRYQRSLHMFKTLSEWFQLSGGR